jgi:hypothetical protein
VVRYAAALMSIGICALAPQLHLPRAYQFPFGNLDQNAKAAQNNFLVDCHSGACSPVSVVNAWAYLQGAFPNIYTGNKTLIGTTTNQIQTSDLVNTAISWAMTT